MIPRRVHLICETQGAGQQVYLWVFVDVLPEIHHIY